MCGGRARTVHLKCDERAKRLEKFQQATDEKAAQFAKQSKVPTVFTISKISRGKKALLWSEQPFVFQFLNDWGGLQPSEFASPTIQIRTDSSRSITNTGGCVS